MSIIPLTPEQRDFAAKNHNLVYSFLNDKHLPEDEFYDIVIFGYLQAVRTYFSKPAARKYSFSTIAYRRMRFSLADYFKSMYDNQCIRADISLDDSSYPDGLLLEERTPSHDTLMLQLEANLILHELAGRVSRQQMEMVRMKSNGYGVRDIARSHKTTINRVKEMLEEIRGILLEICYE